MVLTDDVTEDRVVLTVITAAIKRLVQRPKAHAPAVRVVLVDESHAGHHGVAVFENGKRMAWGANETAALAAYSVSKSSQPSQQSR